MPDNHNPLSLWNDGPARDAILRWIVSGGGVEFMRAFAEDVCGIPPEEVIGSSVVTRYEVRDGPRLGVIIHHDDAEREYAYDRQSTFGRLDRGLDEAQARGWVVVSMKDDWNTIFAHEVPQS
jgi:hypothetical protein